MAYHLLPLLLSPVVAGATHAVVADRLVQNHRNGAAGLGGWLDAPVDEAASQAAAMFEAKVTERMPFILAELQPSLNTSAREAMKFAFADQGLQAAIESSKQQAALALLATAVGAGVVAYLLVKFA